MHTFPLLFRAFATLEQRPEKAKETSDDFYLVVHNIFQFWHGMRLGSGKGLRCVNVLWHF